MSANAADVATSQFECHDGAPRRHLRHRQSVLRMVGPGRVEHPADLTLMTKELCHSRRSHTAGFDPKRQRFQTLKQEPCIERRRGSVQCCV